VQRTGRGKLSEDQLRKYESAADRDVLCWIYENQGKCRYGQKCQWLHLDRDTGQYIPTAYIANSLDSSISVAKKEEEDEETQSEQTKEKGDNDDKKKEESAEDEDAETVDELKAKFEALMKQNIEKRVKEESERKVDQNEEDNKEDSKENADTDKEKKGTGDDGKSKESEKKNYGNYGTTFDRFNVCWEFNTFVGCRKGSKCKWAHQYLAKESAHPYTGEKLNGMAVRKFRKSNDI